jgi:hypothetical protein
MQMFPHPKAQPPQIPLVDNMFAPEILAMAISGLSVLNGIVTVTLESARCDHSKPRADMERFVVARIAMPIPAAQTLMTGLHEFLGQHGLNPLEPLTCQ